MRRLRWIALTLALCLAVAAAVYVNDGYHAGEAAIESLNGDRGVRVSRVDGVWRFLGERPRAALVFYPGGKVDAEAYVPLLSELSRMGLDCYMPEMPLRLAVLKRDAAAGIMAANPRPRWYVGGHSLGGAAASMYAAAHPEGLDGLVLLAAYPAGPLPEGLKTLILRGSRDGVLNIENYEKSRALWPRDAIEVVIEGGNHAGFGDYGPQRGDLAPEISPQAQRAQAAQAIAAFCGLKKASGDGETGDESIGPAGM